MDGGGGLSVIWHGKVVGTLVCMYHLIGIHSSRSYSHFMKVVCSVIN